MSVEFLNFLRRSMDGKHLMRFRSKTTVFKLNLSTVLWTGFQMFQKERNTLRHVRVFKNPEVHFSRD